MSIETAEELKTKRVQLMGKELGLLYDALHNEIIWIKIKWSEFEELYGKNPNRIDLMNRSAPFFFFMVEKVLWNDILLNIARITDNPVVARKRTITIKAVPDLITDAGFKKEVTTQIDSILNSCSFCRDWRNRTIAHKDYILSLDKENAVPLELANRDKINKVLKQFHEFLNLFQAKFFSAELYLDDLTAHRGAESLLYRVRDGLKRSDEVRKRKLAGTATEEDYKREPI